MGKLSADLHYLCDCSKTHREDRLEVCCFWKTKENADSPKDIFEEFEKNYYNKSHKEWCIYYQYELRCNGYDKKKIKNTRDGVRYIGARLHEECHGPLELTQNRIIGAKKLERVEEKIEEILRRQYHEVACLKTTLISEINLKEEKLSTQINIGAFFASILISVGIAKWISQTGFINFTPRFIESIASPYIWFVITISILMLLFTLFRYFQCSIDLNEVKDNLYICFGVDVDRKKEEGKNIIDEAGGNSP